MKFNRVKPFLVCVLLSGCSQTQVPYHLAKSVEKDYRLNFSEIPLGVTQEKIDEDKYRITAKLTELSSHKRISSMALYHSAILAEEQGFDAFLITNTMTSAGCGRYTTRSGRLVASTNGRAQVSQNSGHTTSVSSVEPKVSLKITLIDYESAKKTKKLKLAKDIIKKHKPIIEYIPSKAELDKIAEEREAVCEERRKARKS